MPATGPAFSFTLDQIDCCLILALQGELDLDTVGSLARLLDDLERTSLPAHLLIDLTKLEFMDSTGLRTLLRARELLSGEMSLIAPSLRISRLFEIAGLADTFLMFSDLAAAQERFH